MAEALTTSREDTPKANPQRLLYMLVGVLATLVVVLGAVAAWGFVGSRSAAPGAASVADSGSLVVFDAFIVNLADPAGDRYLKATLRAVSSDPQLAATLERNAILKTKIRDRVITVLASKTFSELSSPIGKETLRRELAREINGLVGANAVDEVLFAELVIQ